jgi:glycosyl hydrolase family 2/WD40 repeat protein
VIEECPRAPARRAMVVGLIAMACVQAASAGQAPAVMSANQPPVVTSDDQTVLLNDSWQGWSTTEPTQVLDVPFSRHPLNGVRFYRKQFQLPPSFGTGVTILRFEGVAGRTFVTLNGRFLGEHHGFTPVWYDVSSLLWANDDNEIVVAIDDEVNLFSIPAGTTWEHQSGIIRDVKLIHNARAVLLGTRLQYAFEASYSRVTGTVVVDAAASQSNGLSFGVELRDDEAGTVVSMQPVGPIEAGDGRIVRQTFSFSVDDPQLWSPETPFLYSLVTTVSQGANPIDQLTQRTGFREVRVDGARLMLNGAPLFLKGICRHDFYPETGFVGTEEAMVEDMQRIKSAGLNYVRLIHYPHHPRVVELADELGLLVSEEIPAWANFANPGVVDRLYEFTRNMILRDMHHPSVFLWIIGSSPDPIAEYATEAVIRAHALDANRLVTFVLDSPVGPNGKTTFEESFVRESGVDLVFKNIYWSDYLESTQAQWPLFPADLPIVISEFGAEGSEIEPVVSVDGTDIWLDEMYQSAIVVGALEAWRPFLPMYQQDSNINGLVMFNFQDVPFPDLPEVVTGHVPTLYFGALYLDRTPKKVWTSITDFFGGLPSSFVGAPGIDDPNVDRRFSAPENLGVFVNSSSRESGSSLSHDGQTTFFDALVGDDPPQSTLSFSMNERDGWSAPIAVGIPADTDPLAIRRSPSVSRDGQSLYFERSVIANSNFYFLPADFYLGDIQIWTSLFDGVTWSAAQNVGAAVNGNDLNGTTTDPSLSADGDRLYFASDRPGGQGGMDVWVSDRTGDAWSPGENLGRIVNSPYDDREPTISASGNTLYFSSNRPGGMGNYDLWVTRRVAGQWTAPENLGPQINSSGDEREPDISSDNLRLYFSAIRSNGLGSRDLWVSSFSCAFFDRNGSGSVDLNDYAALHACTTWPNDDCHRVDSDDDGDVDLIDFGRFQSCVGD